MKKILIFLLLSTPCYPQAWSGLLAPNRATSQWATAGAGTIPTRTVCQTLGTPGQVLTFVQPTTEAAIISALQACANTNQAVVLNPGTYQFASTAFGAGVVTPSGVSLRGSGPDQTRIQFTGVTNNCSGISTAAFCIYNGDSGTMQFSQNYAPITSGLTQGSTSITIGTPILGSTSSLLIGSLIQITQADLATDNGNAWICGKKPSAGVQGCTWGGSSNVWPGRGQFQMARVTNVVGSTITFDIPIIAPNWSLSQTPYVAWSINPPVVGFGLEDIQINTQMIGDMERQVNWMWATNSWAKNVAFINNDTPGSAAARKHADIMSSTNITIRDSYLYSAAAASDAYGIDVRYGSTNILIENNIAHHIAAPYITEGAMDVVFGYNFAADNYYVAGFSSPGIPNNPYWQQCDAVHHDEADMYILFEGQEGICMALDNFHGTSFAITGFRNRFNGRDPANQCPGGGTSCGTGYSGATKIQFTGAIMPLQGSRYANFVANVLGTSTYATNYADIGVYVDPANGGSGHCASPIQTSIYQANYSNQNYLAWYNDPSCYWDTTVLTVPLDNDPLTWSTAMKWGNYDTVNNSVLTNSGDTASTASTYPGLVSPSTTWASYPSFYLSSKPSWFGALPFPLVGPDVTGGNITGVGGHAYHNAAANCFLNTMGGSVNGSSAALPFNANTCYAAAPAAGFVITKHGPSNI